MLHRYAGFLVLFFLVLAQQNGRAHMEITRLEVFFFLWSFSLWLEEMLQATPHPHRRPHNPAAGPAAVPLPRCCSLPRLLAQWAKHARKGESHLADGWNKLDVLSLTMLVAVLPLRLLALQLCECHAGLDYSMNVYRLPGEGPGEGRALRGGGGSDGGPDPDAEGGLNGYQARTPPATCLDPSPGAAPRLTPTVVLRRCGA